MHSHRAYRMAFDECHAISQSALACIVAEKSWNCLPALCCDSIASPSQITKGDRCTCLRQALGDQLKLGHLMLGQ